MTPFPAHVHAERRRRAAAQATEAGLDGVLVTPGPDMTYFLGYTPSAVTERLTMLVIDAGYPDAATAVVPRLEEHDLEIGAVGGVETLAWSDGEDEHEVAARLLRDGGRYAISDTAWALHVLGLQRAAPEASFEAVTRALPLLRAAKSPEEVARLAAAGAGADAAFREIVRRPFAGRRERDVAADLAELLREHGHEQVDFTLVCAGENGADPHHAASDRVLREGDTVVMDFGGLADGYGSDTTRTVHVGEPTALEREVHDAVRAAQQAGVEAVRPGATCEDVDRAARAVIEEAGFGEHFVHRTGHGIGLTTHEPPYMVTGETTPVGPGMCFSVEPGIYLPGRFGVRIEDVVVAFPVGVPGLEDVPDGAARLNTTTRELVVVE
ncbi:aminopeptidase P family protein [Isoptericola variabilis]|uniref:Peptidase M24 n=1 Tax=Isoptericola variabilis (strain 225) TaxID=743718 RepID=F6FPL6_ISOV2|nr:aminopeptidase P family protein [Isoptericola variabilis]AEG44748.1 peptidase M24 [Isoptericola variabilis 225]TWH32361.1 Xaa-Pro aminopeptidase [Isoptericola variabilis J7]